MAAVTDTKFAPSHTQMVGWFRARLSVLESRYADASQALIKASRDDFIAGPHGDGEYELEVSDLKALKEAAEKQMMEFKTRSELIMDTYVKHTALIEKITQSLRAQ